MPTLTNTNTTQQSQYQLNDRHTYVSNKNQHFPIVTSGLRSRHSSHTLFPSQTPSNTTKITVTTLARHNNQHKHPCAQTQFSRISHHQTINFSSSHTFYYTARTLPSIPTLKQPILIPGYFKNVPGLN